MGITEIEMAESRPPNTDISSVEQLLHIVNRPPPTLRMGGSKEFNSFIAKCLVKNPLDRPTAKDLLEVIVNFSSFIHSLIYPIPIPKRLHLSKIQKALKS